MTLWSLRELRLILLVLIAAFALLAIGAIAGALVQQVVVEFVVVGWFA